ncbi:MAG TPA: hypothetical protein VJK29_12560 [Terriglobales bacterium]|nr:hypothetical protein [Terriglobales bacterium]
MHNKTPWSEPDSDCHGVWLKPMERVRSKIDIGAATTDQEQGEIMKKYFQYFLGHSLRWLQELRRRQATVVVDINLPGDRP